MRNRLLVYFTFSHGNGGHCHSITSYYDEFKRISDSVFLLNLGCSESQLNKDRDGFYASTTMFNFFLVIFSIIKIVKDKDINEILCIDKNSYAYLRLVSLFLGIKIVLVKPGGPNPKYFFPKANALVNFSNESDLFFKSIPKFKSTKLFVISNRVHKITHHSFSQTLEDIKKHHDIVLMRVSRIGSDYINSLILTIKEFKVFNDNNPSSCLVIIGTIEEQGCLEELIYLSSTNNIIFLNDNIHTKNSKRYLHYCNIYIGCGRSAMEAIAENKVVCIPSSISNKVILFNQNSAKSIGDTNFSPRVNYDGLTLSQLNFSICQDSVFTIHYFNKNLDIAKIGDEYQKVFDLAQSEKIGNILDIIKGLTMHFIELARFLISKFSK
ncbi:MAG: hypothetical protein ACI9OE_002040 [Mariniflexile sp.]|jgi:hypothetical protein